MKKIMTTIAVLTMGASVASAALIDFQFNETGPVEITSAVDAGTLGESFGAVFTNGVVSGGSFTVTDNTVGHSSTIQGFTPITTGKIQLETSLTWDFTGLDVNDSMRYLLSDSAGNSINIQLINITNGGGKHKVKAIGSGDATDKKLVGAFAGQTGTIGLRMIADLDAATYTAEYNQGTGWIDMGATLGGITDFSKLSLTADDWAGDGTGFASTDYLKVTVIPEPATLGLIAATGAGLLFIRRRFA
jgi:hypothetical protein